MTDAFARAVAQTSGKPHLLDSNKETARGLFLLRYMPQARVIHLVRDPRGVLRSHYWRVAQGRDFRFMDRHHSSGRMGPFWLVVAAASWTVGNALREAAPAGCANASSSSATRTFALTRPDRCAGSEPPSA